ncbi:hypothetical protein OIDMADRAFT_25571 [Oidiodendron maius Zn]|uniref:Uncharacterized protein n=1 Tax=Oidiodendron maius (strain Zn) TaxID=913774 RepID=A0A0C3DSC0_OIDMZ|nr:hypothetical protein OIDMADRAFT_25571 [Oidiodendron maius Zn]
MSPTQGSRHQDAHNHHRRVIDTALKTIASPNWNKRSLAIDKIFTLLHDAPHLSKYHRAQICSLLAKHGDEADLEITEYAIKTVELAQAILQHEKPRTGSCARQAIEDLILDARDTLKIRCPEVGIPEDVMEPIRYVELKESRNVQDSVFEEGEDNGKYIPAGEDGSEDEDDESDSDDDDEEQEEDSSDDCDEEDQDENSNQDGQHEHQEVSSPSSTCSTTPSNPMDISTNLSFLALTTTPFSPSQCASSPISHLNNFLPSPYTLLHTPPLSEVSDFAFDVEPQDVHLLGLILTLVLRDREGMQRTILRFARRKGVSDIQIAEMVRGAFVPRRKVENGEGEGETGRKRRRVEEEQEERVEGDISIKLCKQDIAAGLDGAPSALQ